MSKRAWKVLLILGLIVGLVWWWVGRRRAPDERLARHFENICDIAEENTARPRVGVDRLFGYLGDHGPEMMRDFGDLLVQIERIDDDADHDARARDAARRLQEPLIGCADTLQRFGQAVQADPEASAHFERGVERLGRTLGILFDVDGRRLAPRDLGRWLPHVPD